MSWPWSAHMVDSPDYVTLQAVCSFAAGMPPRRRAGRGAGSCVLRPGAALRGRPAEDGRHHHPGTPVTAHVHCYSCTPTMPSGICSNWLHHCRVQRAVHYTASCCECALTVLLRTPRRSWRKQRMRRWQRCCGTAGPRRCCRTSPGRWPATAPSSCASAVRRTCSR